MKEVPSIYSNNFSNEPEIPKHDLPVTTTSGTFKKMEQNQKRTLETYFHGKLSTVKWTDCSVKCL